jgi:hypothetical protein
LSNSIITLPIVPRESLAEMPIKISQQTHKSSQESQSDGFSCKKFSPVPNPGKAIGKSSEPNLLRTNHNEIHPKSSNQNT